MANEPAKRTSFPHMVAATMKRQLDRKQDGEIGYTIQQVSRYRIEDIQDAFKPLSSDLAQWFKRIAKDNNSPGFAIKEMHRIVTYTDMIWPEMKAAIDECKDQILPMILKLIRDKHEEEAGRYVKILRDLEITWPELRIISGSLLESTDVDDQKAQGRQMIIDILRKKANDSSRGIFYMMYHLDDWGLNLKDWPEIRSIIDDRKEFLMREILKGLTVPTDMDNAIDYAGFMAKRMKKIGVTWPELDVIERSVSKDRIEETDDLPGLIRPDLSHYSEEEQIAAVRRYTPILQNFPNATDRVKKAAVETNPFSIGYLDDQSEELQLIAIEKSTGALRAIKNPTDKVAWRALKASASSIRDLKNPSAEMQMHAVSRYPELIKYIKNPTPEVQIEVFSKEPKWIISTSALSPTIWKDDNVKNAVMRYVLTALKEGDPVTAKDMVDQMVKHGCDWPEIEIMAYSIDSELDNRPIDEGRGESPTTVIMRNFRSGVTTGLQYMSMYGKTIQDIPEAGEFIENRKEFVIRKMLSAFCNGDPEELEMMIALLRDAGVAWPELYVIEKSFSSEFLDHTIGEADNDEEHDGEDFGYGRAWRAKLEYQEFLKDLRHDIETESWDLAALDLIDIGMTEIEDVLPTRTKQMIEQNKDNLIRGILERMKVGRYMEMTIHAVDGLNNMGINWPELQVIRRSLTSDSKKDQA